MKQGKEKKKKRPSTFLALLPSMLIGAFCGLSMVIFSEEYAEKSGLDPLLLLLSSLLFLIAAVYLQTIVHELGHLVFGLLSGYRFCSFRIGSLMLVRTDGKLRLAYLSIAGTAGQCLMCPPDPDSEGRIPVKLYNLGGALMNLLITALCIPLYLLLRPHFICAFFFMSAGIGLLFALTNGIPMRLGMVDNDGYNAFSLGKDPYAIRAFWLQLKVNEQSTAGVRLADMPGEWFSLPEEADRKNPLIVAIDVFACNRLLDALRLDEAEAAIRTLLERESGIIDLHKSLLICDLITILIANGREEEASAYLTKEQKKFMRMMRTFISVIRTEYLIAKYVEKNVAAAETQQKLFDKITRKSPTPAEIEAERVLMALPETRITTV